MPLVLAQERAQYSLATAANQLQPPEILQNSHRATPENFDALFRKRLVPVREVANGAQRTIRKAQGADYIVGAVLARIRKRASLDFHWRRLHQEAQEVHKVTDLTQDTASALLWIIEPVVRGKKACVPTIVNRQWLMDFLQKTFHMDRERRKSTIETNHQNTALSGWTIMCLRDPSEFCFIEAQRFLAKDMLAGIQGCDDLFGVEMVARSDYNCVNRRIAKNFLLIRSARTESKFPGSVAGVRTRCRT